MTKPNQFRRVAIINRGDAAVRLIRAAREIGDEGGTPLSTVALFTDGDRRAMFVRAADRAVPLGPATFIDERDGRRKSIYEDSVCLERALSVAEVDAAWLGWGWSADHQARVAEICTKLGIVFVGPSAALARTVIDPMAVTAAAEKAGLETARLTNPRHLAVQILGDQHGTVLAVSVRDGTVRLGDRTLVEEAPSPALDSAADADVRSAATRLGQALGFVGVGTVLFEFEVASRKLSFVGVHAGQEACHPASEVTTGLDLVKLELDIARGGRLPAEATIARGHALQVCLAAEDPEHNFAAAPGHLELLRMPTGPGVRVDTGITSGDDIPADLDRTICRITAVGSDREEALGRLRRAVRETTALVRGGATNKGFMLRLLAKPELKDASLTGALLEKEIASGEHLSRDHFEVALLDSAIAAYAAKLADERRSFFASAARGRPTVQPESRRAVELRLRGQAYRFQVQQLGPSEFRLDGGGGPVDVRVDEFGPFERRLSFGERQCQVAAVQQNTTRLVEVEGVLHRVSLDAAGMVRAPTPAMVLAVPATVGRKVAAGERLAILESMKMEMDVVAPFAGRVREVLVNSNTQVHVGAPLVLLEPIDHAFDDAEVTKVRIDAAKAAAPSDPRARWTATFQEVKRLLLGFDLDAAEAKRVTAAWTEASLALPPEDAELLRAEQQVLAAFTDIHSLFRRQPPIDEPDGLEDRSTHEYFVTYLRAIDGGSEHLPPNFREKLSRALSHYGVQSLDRTPELEDALVRIYKSHGRGDQQATVAAGTLDRWLLFLATPEGDRGDDLLGLLSRLVSVSQGRFATVNDLARQVRYRCFDQPVFERIREEIFARMDGYLSELARDRSSTADQHAAITALVDCPQPLVPLVVGRFEAASPAYRATLLDVLTRRHYRIRSLEGTTSRVIGAQQSLATARYDLSGQQLQVLATYTTQETMTESVNALAGVMAELPKGVDILLDVFVRCPTLTDAETSERELRAAIERIKVPRPLLRISVIAIGGETANRPSSFSRRLSQVQHFTFRPDEQGAYHEDKLYRGLHPMMAKRVHLFRLSNFNTERLPTVEDVFLFRAVAKDNPKDERLIGVAEVRDLTPVRDAAGKVVSVPHLERMLHETLSAIRAAQARRAPHERLQYNRVLLHVWPSLDVSNADFYDVVRKLAPATEGLGIEQTAVLARIVVDSKTGELKDQVIRVSATVGQGLRVTMSDPSDAPMRTLSEYQQRVSQLRRRGLVYPYEILRLMTPPPGSASGDFPAGDFAEYDLDAENKLVPVSRPQGKNTANIVVGVITNYTSLYPQGMKRVILLGDPSREMGSVAEPECRRIAAALDLAESLKVPCEWFTHCAGAKIAMDSGTENMDWVSVVLRRLIEFTQAGHEINVVVCGINVGAQPYWNAEATMLMHTRGILVMTPDGAMVLTGKQSLDYSGSVSAEDNQGIGGYDRIMGPNGQAQYLAADIGDACRLLMAHYDHAYVAPGERFPRRATTTDPFDRDVRTSAHPPTADFTLVGDVFSDEKNPGRKKPFEIRAVMAAVADRDHKPLERWKDMRDAGTGVVWDAHVGGFPVCMLGIESHPLRRLGFVAADGPEQLTSGTLYPQASKKIARAVNAASNNRPLVVLANLSGFDGSPESMRTIQLEYGAEIGRAVTNFKGPIVFAVVSRYHGGAFVVFSKQLNEHIEAVALEGTYASVIGGAPAAAVVFSREVDGRTNKDPRIVGLQDEINKASGDQKRRLTAKLADLKPVVRSEKLGAVADEFDQVHSVHRALKTGSLDRIIPAHTLRPYIIDALERGIAKFLGR